MNNVEILRKAIKQAEAHGFTGLAKGWDVDIWKHAGLDDHSEPYVKEPAGAGDYRAIPWQVVIYNHSFAEALWTGYECDCGIAEKAYPEGGVHPETCAIAKNKDPIGMLRAVVSVKNPIGYLGQNI